MHQNPDNTAFNLHVLHVRRPSNSFYIVMSLDNESIIPQQLQDQGTIKKGERLFFHVNKGKTSYTITKHSKKYGKKKTFTLLKETVNIQGLISLDVQE